MEETERKLLHSDYKESELNPGDTISGVKQSLSNGGFIVGDIYPIGLSSGANKTVAELPDNTEVTIKCLAPGKFEVWA